MSGLTRSHTDVQGQREKLERGSQGGLHIGFEGGVRHNLAGLCDLEKFQGIILDGEEAENSAGSQHRPNYVLILSKPVLCDKLFYHQSFCFSKD